MWLVFSGAISHTPRPLTSATIAVTAITRAAPLRAISTPITTNGTVLPIRWPKPAWRNGAVTMPIRPSVSCGSIPYWSSLWLSIVSTTSDTHITRTIRPMTAKPSSRGLRLAGVAVSTPPTVTGPMSARCQRRRCGGVAARARRRVLHAQARAPRPAQQREPAARKPYPHRPRSRLGQREPLRSDPQRAVPPAGDQRRQPPADRPVGGQPHLDEAGADDAGPRGPQHRGLQRQAAGVRRPGPGSAARAAAAAAALAGRSAARRPGAVTARRGLRRRVRRRRLRRAGGRGRVGVDDAVAVDRVEPALVRRGRLE